jgi:hypothetical protein
MKFIHFSCSSDQELGTPVPLKNVMPQWYKDAETFFTVKDQEVSLDGENEEKNAGLKTCAPFLDSLLNGYAVLTPFDIYVKKTEDGSLDLKWNAPPQWEEFIAERPGESGATMPRPAGHHPNHLVWASHWGVKAPRGYSLIFTHPLNRFDLPFTTMSGIIDSDKFYGNGNVPFFIKEDFVGVIPKGTPFLQIIPVKRNSWKMLVSKGLKDKMHVQGMIAREKETKYKRKLWVRKEFR